MIEPPELAPRASRGGRRYSGAYPPRLLPIEHALVVLIEAAPNWVIVDQWTKKPQRGSSYSAMTVALRRRGADIAVRTDSDDPTQWVAYARWTHPHPDGLPWMEHADGTST